MFRKPPKRPFVLGQWSRLPTPAESPEDAAATRARIVGAIARAMRTEGTTPRRPPALVRTWIVAGFAAAAMAASVAGIAVFHPRRAASSGAQSPNAAAVAYDSHIATDRDSSSRLQLRSGVEVVVGPDTRLAIPDPKDAAHLREELALELGVVRVRVPKLPPGHTFAIRTPNALVSVHGTAFSVQVTKAGPSDVARTSVIVTEGVVSVRHGDREILLDPGTEWTSSVVEAAPMAPSDVTSGASSEDAHGVVRPTQRPAQDAHRGPAAARPGSADVVNKGAARESQTDLANQNRLFSEAMSARDRGDRVRAVSLFEQFIRSYPASPLTQDAYVARFRTLAQTGDHAAAERAAGAYLALYADGVAAGEARALAGGFDSGL